MTVTVADFRTIFPEFGDVGMYPDAQATYWLAQGYEQLSAARFGNSIDLAAMLYTAHNIVLSARAAKSQAAGQIAGDASGVETSKSIGSVSVGYDAHLTSYAKAGPYNATAYGQRLFQLMKAFTAGPTYVLPGVYPPGTTSLNAVPGLPLFGFR